MLLMLGNEAFLNRLKFGVFPRKALRFGFEFIFSAFVWKMMATGKKKAF